MSKELPEGFPNRWHGGDVTIKDPNGNGRLKLDPRLAVSIIGWIVSVVLAWGYVNTKLAVVETKVERLQQDLTDMRGDVKALLRRP